MGTWSAPRTTKQAKKLAKLMSNPLAAEVAQSKLYNILGDDLLFDYIDQCSPKADVRPLVKLRLAHFLETQGCFFKKWDSESISICKKIIHYVYIMNNQEIINHCFYFESEKLEMLTCVVTGIDANEDKVTHKEIKKLQNVIEILESIVNIPDLEQFYKLKMGSSL